MCGLYIHIPFCTKKCSYCDFVSFGGRSELLPQYLTRLKKEAKYFEGEKISTVFIGGGTPSLMSSEQITDLMQFLFDTFDLSQASEITVECNPQSVTLEKLFAYKKAGVTRISIGAQSLSDSTLKEIGRCHTVEELESAVANAKLAGFHNFNLDLIFALPNQTLDMWANTLTNALNLEPKHISCYSLILDASTPMGKAYERGELDIPDESTERDMYHLTVEMLKAHGIRQYEISNFAQEGFECRHNINYWLCGEYIGLGCAAHSFYKGERYSNTADLKEYLFGNDIKRDAYRLTENDSFEEKLMLGLRMNRGIDISSITEKINKHGLKRYIELKMLTLKGNHLSLTDLGRDFCDKIVLDLIS